MRKFIKKMAQLISKANNYTNDEAEQVEYALKMLIFEIIKIIGVIITFSLLGHSMQAIIAVVAMAIVKPFIGGYHEDSQIKCFIATLVVVGSIIYLSSTLSINFVAKLILSMVSLYCIYEQAPVINPAMQLTRDELIKRNRAIGIIISMVLILISIVFYKYELISNTILWTIVFQALLMFNKRTV